MKTAHGYIRVSHDPKKEKLSPEIQRQRIAEYCKLKSWLLLETFEDIDVPGSTFNRPGWDALIKQIDNCEVIVATEFTRIGRSMRETINRIEDLHSIGKDVVAIDDDIDTTTASGKMMFHVILALSQFERDRLSERIAAVHVQLAKEERWPGGHAPLGYFYGAAGLEVDADEAELVRRIFADRRSGYGYSKIAALLFKEGVNGKHGGRIEASTIKGILSNRAYIGERVFKGEVLSLSVEPVIERGLWEQVQATITRDKHNPGGRHLLSGLLKCGKCGATLYHHPPNYYCGNAMRRAGECTGVMIRTHIVEPYVEKRFFEHLDRQRYKKAIERQKPVRLSKSNRAEAVRRKQEKLWNEFSKTDTTITREQFNRLNEQLTTQYGSAKREEELRDADQKLPPVEVPEEAWGILDTDQKREALKGFIHKITVKPGKLKPEIRLNIKWKV
jgi:DNA invertase Pin-like site-specific DNA recombinase